LDPVGLPRGAVGLVRGPLQRLDLCVVAPAAEREVHVTERLADAGIGGGYRGRHQRIISNTLWGMRTTITLDDDVAVELEKLRRKSGGTFKQVVNETLRAGLRPAPRQPAERVQYTQPRDLGALVDVSDVSALLTVMDEEKYAYLVQRDDA
jgi:hypothetical protein